MPSASSFEPVLPINFCNTLGWAACQANNEGTKGSADISLATGENTCPASPPSGCKAPLILTICCGLVNPSSAIRTAMAAPAEWPTTSTGLAFNTISKLPIALAIPGSDICSIAASAGGMLVKAWPGRSSDSTLKCGVSKGTNPRQVCVDAPVP